VSIGKRAFGEGRVHILHLHDERRTRAVAILDALIGLAGGRGSEAAQLGAFATMDRFAVRNPVS